MKVALVGYQEQARYSVGVTNDESRDLLTFLTGKGVDITAVVWNDSNVQWKAYNVVIIKSPWDYHENLPEFIEWLDMLASLNVKVLNPVDVVKWNSNKRYLLEIADKGLKVIQSAYLEKGSSFDGKFFDRFNTDKLVIKPCVSAGAKNTLIISKADFAERIKEIDALLAEEDFLVQPFIKEIKEGEWSFLFFNGTYSHSVLKTPKQGDFRVQHYHGGSISYPAPEQQYISQAAEYVQAAPSQTLYARVDGVIKDGVFQLMELEMIEPYLYFDGDNERLERYYNALIALTA